MEFPRLFSLSLEKEGTLSRFLALRETSREWNLLPRRVMFEWERLEWLRLVSVLSFSPAIRGEVSDCTRWAANGSGLFSVSSLYSLSNTEGDTHLRLSKLVGNSALPP